MSLVCVGCKSAVGVATEDFKQPQQSILNYSFVLYTFQLETLWTTDRSV